jgi:hypothetical protein
MLNRTRTIHLVFRRPFLLPGDATPLAGGDYVVTIEEERLEGLSFEVWRRTGTWLVVGGAGRVELRPVTVAELDRIIELDTMSPGLSQNCVVTPVPLEEKA